MLFYVARRLVYTLPIIIGVSIICFLLIHLAPGDPLSAVLPENASPQLLADVRAAYGFDKPMPQQYLLWLGKVVRGDLGSSIISQRPVLGEVVAAVRNTVSLAVVAIAIGFVVGLSLGAIAGYTSGSYLDRVVTAISITGVAIPHYWLGMVLIIVFSVNLGVLPSTGMGAHDGSLLAGDTWRHMVLPAITLAAIPAGIIARTVRGAVSEARKQDFVQTLYSQGLRERHVIKHIAKNAAPTILAVMGLQMAQLLGGSILVETVFAWPGTGFLLNSAIFSRDLPVLQGTILVLAMFFVLTNLAVDILQMLFDPRLTRA
jgi:peptide/nickel transport system permease protein